MCKIHDFGSIQSKQEVFTMLGFTYYTPTKVAFGKGSVEKVGELMKQFGGTDLRTQRPKFLR